MGKLKYVLDTNHCIHFLNGQFELNLKIDKVGEENCFISEITILELLYGVANSDSTKKVQNKLKLFQFLEGFENRILPIRPVFEAFSEQKVQLRKKGTPISDFDLLIGCTALTQNMTMVSRNIKEMKRIEGLTYENWID